MGSLPRTMSERRTRLPCLPGTESEGPPRWPSEGRTTARSSSPPAPRCTACGSIDPSFRCRMPLAELEGCAALVACHVHGRITVMVIYPVQTRASRVAAITSARCRVDVHKVEAARHAGIQGRDAAAASAPGPKRLDGMVFLGLFAAVTGKLAVYRNGKALRLGSGSLQTARGSQDSIS